MENRAVPTLYRKKRETAFFDCQKDKKLASRPLELFGKFFFPFPLSLREA